MDLIKYNSALIVNHFERGDANEIEPDKNLIGVGVNKIKNPKHKIKKAKEKVMSRKENGSAALAIGENTSLVIPEGMDMAILKDGFDKTDLDGVTLRLGQIGIIHQGQMFKMPTGEKVPNFEGVLIDITAVNAWWETSFDQSGGGTPPDCFSMNGIVMSPMSAKPQGGEDGLCAGCHRNKFGSDGARGKSCKNMKRLHIMTPEGQFPKRLTIPPTSIRSLDDFVSLVSDRSIPFWKLKILFGLKEASNKEGIEYSALDMTAIGFAATSKEGFDEILAMRDRHMEVMKEQDVDPSEFDPSLKSLPDDDFGETYEE